MTIISDVIVFFGIGTLANGTREPHETKLLSNKSVPCGGPIIAGTVYCADNVFRKTPGNVHTGDADGPPDNSMLPGVPAVPRVLRTLSTAMFGSVDIFPDLSIFINDLEFIVGEGPLGLMYWYGMLAALTAFTKINVSLLSIYYYYLIINTYIKMEIQVKLSDGAVMPTKAHPEDTGYDLTLISLVKDNGGICMFDTGVSVKPPAGYYIDVVPRSSFSKTGYMFSNSVGVIDSTYRGTIKIMIKGDETLKNMMLPFTGFQMILRKLELASIRQVESLDETDRGCGGFGSSDWQEPLGC